MILLLRKISINALVLKMFSNSDQQNLSMFSRPYIFIYDLLTMSYYGINTPYIIP